MTKEKLPIEGSIIDAFLDSEQEFTINLNPPKNPILRFIYLKVFPIFKFYPLQKTIKARGLKMGTIYLVSSILQKIKIQKLGKNNELDWMWELIYNNSLYCAEIVATFIRNDGKKPKQKEIDLVLNSIQYAKLEEITRLYTDSIDVSSFINSITSMKSLDLMSQNEVSPADTQETIARGGSLEAQ